VHWARKSRSSAGATLVAVAGPHDGDDDDVDEDKMKELRHGGLRDVA